MNSRKNFTEGNEGNEADKKMRRGRGCPLLAFVNFWRSNVGRLLDQVSLSKCSRTTLVAGSCEGSKRKSETMEGACIKILNVRICGVK
jgi:hypothetical protein